MNRAIHSLPLAAVITLCSCGTAGPSSPATESSAERSNSPAEPPAPPTTGPHDTLRVADGSDVAPASVHSLDWQRYFGKPTERSKDPDTRDAPRAAQASERQGCFLGLDTATGAWTRNDAERCAERFRPFSTYKIPHALIGLETGVLTDADSVIEWDRQRYPAENWWPAVWRERNDLRSAVTYSVVPYFRSLARRIGAEAMQKHLDGFAYGNRSIAGGLDHFWLDGDLAISAVEQIQFLRALHQGSLPVSSRTAAIVLDILIRERGSGYVIRAKTGTGRLPDGSALGWYVGSVETPGGLYLFAMNITGPDYDDIPRHERIATSEAILSDLGILPRDRAAR